MGFISGIISATVKVAITPVAIIKDVVNVINDKEVNATEGLPNSAKNDINNATDSLVDGEL